MSKRAIKGRMAGGNDGRHRILVIEPADAASDDGSIATLVDAAGCGRWLVDCKDGAEARDSLRKPQLRMVLIDEAAVAASERGWLLGQIRRHAPAAGVIYIARDHNHEIERDVRARGVLHYTSWPIERDRLVQLMRAFLASTISRPT